MRAFAQAERFVSEVEKKKLRPAYVFVGDEVFFRKRFREAILEHLVPNDVRDFSLFDFDLAETDLSEVLDRARTPSLMVPCFSASSPMRKPGQSTRYATGRWKVWAISMKRSTLRHVSAGHAPA